MKDLIQLKFINKQEYKLLLYDIIKLICLSLIIYVFDSIDKYYNVLQCIFITKLLYHLNIIYIIKLY